MLNEDDKNNWSKYILDHYNNTSIGSGLFFGKLGVAITLAKLGVNFERNIPLLDLLFDLNENTKKLDASLANGITGLLIGFNILSKLTTYPNFVNIRQELVKELIQNHQLSENGLEYGKLGVVFGVFFLKANDILFNNLSGPKDFEDIKNDIKQVIQEYTKNDIFLGIPDRCAQLDCSTLYSRIKIFQRKGYRVHLRILQSQGEACCKDCPLKDCLKK